MADNRIDPADIVSQLANYSNKIVVDNASAKQGKLEEIYLASIDTTLKHILENGQNISWSNANNSMPGDAGDKGRYFRSKSASFNSKDTRSIGNNARKGFTDGFEDAIWESFLGSDFKSKLRDTFDGFADMMGISVQDIPSTLGKAVGNKLIDSVKNTSLGDNLFKSIDDIKSNAANSIKDAFNRGVNKKVPGSNFDWDEFQSERKAAAAKNSAASYTEPKDNTSNKIDQISIAATMAVINVEKVADDEDAADAIKSGADKADKISEAAKMAESDAAKAAETEDTIEAAEVMSNMSSAGFDSAAAMSGLGEVVAMVGPEIAVAGAAIVAVIAAIEIGSFLLGKFKDALQPAIDGAKQFGESLSSASNRTATSRKQYAENAANRLKEDVKTLIEKPFEILEDAAKELYDAWDSSVREINGTQGYSKSDLQDLLSSYATRLRSEGLSSVVSSSDIITNLTKVLESGLSGTVAEEFAYQATKLNAEIPTQDFFDYASTYASLAANAIKDGASQSEAIAYANSELESFASSVLYASRQLTGGFSTGLTNAETLFTQAVQIAQASKTGDASTIAGVLTSVSAVVGAIAPDLASTLTDAVYNAAVGGNSSELVALRSLAGVNASNTAFLQELANNPKQVYSTLFSNLAQLQNMSPDNFMEVAESLSDIFGISKEAFQRVDFEYLAEAISQMDVNSSSLDENLALLASGETTTTAEQLRMQQINEYMIDEGLSYVLDNEAARAIQQHMWDEQIANEIMEAEYGVNIQGTALEFLSGISTTIDNILNFLNPFRGISRKLTDLTASIAESYAEEEDIAKVLELGKVGNGNATAFAQLTTRGTDLNLTDSLVSLLGGHSSYETIEGIRKISQTLTGNSISNAIDNKVASSLLNYTTGALTSMSLGTSSPTSSYKWGTVGKSTASALSSLLANSKNTSYTNASVTTSGTSSSQSEDDKKIAQVTEIVSGMAEWYKNNGTETRTDVFGNEYTVYRDYEDWVSDSGLSKVSDYIEDAGFTEQQLQEAYENMQSQSSAQEELDRIQREQEFYSIGIDNLPYLPQIYEELYDQNENTLKVTIYDRLGDIYDQLTDQNTQTLKVIIAGKLDTINSTLSGFVKSWTDYYVNHTTYNNHLGKSLTDQITAIQSEEKGKSDTAISRLADVLTQTASDLADPTVQTNVLLAEVLKVVTTIMQQNNNKTTSTQLGTSLSALALGLQT